MRRRGLTYTYIERALKIPRSTLDYWLNGLSLSDKARLKIKAAKQRALIDSRKLATQWHKDQKQVRIQEAKRLVLETYKNFEITRESQELLLGMLYLGEGFKNRASIALGNSDPKILGMFVGIIRRVYKIDEKKFRCFLYLRADQDEQKEKKYWANKLRIPRGQFRKSQFDMRTVGRKTREGYHGVCAVHYYDASLEKRLSAIQQLLTERLGNLRG